jgi:quinol monooxygenase YgiN
VADDGPVRVVAIYPVRDVDEFCAQLATTYLRRNELGVLKASVHRSVDNPNELMVTFEMRSQEDALALFTSDDRVRAWMDGAGVEAYPAFFVGAPVGAVLPTSD